MTCISLPSPGHLGQGVSIRTLVRRAREREAQERRHAERCVLAFRVAHLLLDAAATEAERRDRQLTLAVVETRLCNAVERATGIACLCGHEAAEVLAF